MAQILVRQIGGDVKEKLRARAAHKSRSLEAEVRAILTEAVATDDLAAASTVGFGRQMAELFKHSGFTKEEADAFDKDILKRRRASTFGE
jgi:plasmid stability protein